MVIVAKVDNALRLSAVDRKATALGLTIGQPLANARAMLPALKVVAANDPADLKLLTQIADWCDYFTPFVALDGPRHLLLDVTGVSHLFGGEKPMLDLIRNSLQAQGFAARGAMAGTSVAARALARYSDGTIVDSGEEEQAMRSLPVEALNLDVTTTHALRRAGLKTVSKWRRANVLSSLRDWVRPCWIFWMKLWAIPQSRSHRANRHLIIGKNRISLNLLPQKR